MNVQERYFKIDSGDSMYNLISSTKMITELRFFGSPKSVFLAVLSSNMVQGVSELHNISEAREARKWEIVCVVKLSTYKISASKRHDQ